MKILHVFDHSLPNLDGYAVRGAAIVRAQRQIGLDPIVLTSSQHDGDFVEGPEFIGGIAHYRTRSIHESSVPFVREMRRVQHMTRRLWEVVEKERPRLLHAHSPCLWGQATGRVARAAGLPSVYEIRGFWEDAAVDRGKTRTTSFRYRFSRYLESRVARQAGSVVVIAAPLQRDLEQRGLPREKIFCVPNGVDTAEFVPRDRDHALAARLKIHDHVTVGFVGSLFAWEGIECLIRAAEQVLRVEKNVRFIIVGGGEHAPLVQQLVAAGGLADRIIYVPPVPHGDILRYYSLLDILVYPRLSTRNTETVTPLKPLEAMSMEKSILGSDVGGIRELLPNDTGLLFRAGNVDDLTEKCLLLIRSETLRQKLGKNAGEYVRKERDWSNIVTKYLAAYAYAESRK